MTSNWITHMGMALITACGCAFTLITTTQAETSDWPRFRGPNGSGVNADNQDMPKKWSVTNNTKWRLDLPGPGHSSPIIVKNHVFLTCWTGYDVDAANPGSRDDLRLHLLCVDRSNGVLVWNQEIEPIIPASDFLRDPMFDGYASHTPTSDGEKVFVYLGTTGLVAFDLKGTKLWQTRLGDRLGPKGEVSTSSPILYKNLVIVTASIEDRAVYALDKETGAEVWQWRSESLTNTWGTPALVTSKDRTDLVISTPYKIFGLNPDDGKLQWQSVGSQDTTTMSSIITADGVAYVIGGRGGGTVAVQAGGTGDVTETLTLWESGRSGTIITPLHKDDRLHWVYRDTAFCLDAKTGKVLYRKRLSPSNVRGASNLNSDYASLVAAGNTMYHLRPSGELVAIRLGEEFIELGTTVFDGGGTFHATPAISRGEMFVRSTKHLYCISKD